MSREQIKEYDVLRVIVTFLVIIGHCTYATIETNTYGIWDYSAYTASGLSLFYQLSSKAVALIYTFHMPLYMMLSGALFRYTNYTGGYNSLRDLISIKAKKLLIPFFVVTLCYVVPLKMLSGYYAGSTNLWTDILVGQVLLEGNNHLWFLPALFAIFLMVYFANRLLPNACFPKLLGSFIFFCASDFVPVALISNSLHYLL